MKPKDDIDKGTFIKEEDLGPELTEDNCTPELWKELNGDNDPFDVADTDKPE